MFTELFDTLSRIAIDQLAPTDALAIAAPAVALLTLYLYLPTPRRVLGPRAGAWNPIRRVLLPPLDRLKREHTDGGYAKYRIGSEEYVGRLDASLEDVEAYLWDDGFERMPLAALKRLEDGRLERGSWAKRDDLLAERQLHVMLFDADGGVDVYAHEEYNALHPVFAYKHYRGIDYSPADGVRRVAVQFADRDDFDPSDQAIDSVDLDTV